MSFITEESAKDRELNKKVNAAFSDDPDFAEALKSRERRAREKREARQRDYEQKQKTLELKRRYLEWQKESQARNRAERLKREEEKRKKLEQGKDDGSKISYETISDKDKDPTAYKKAIGGVASFGKAFGKAAIGVGARAVISAAKKRRAKKEQERQQAAQKAIEGQRERTQSAMKQSTRLLPGHLAGETSGQRARRDPNFKKREIERRGGTVSEEFSCWREEFLYELKELREKKKKDDEDYIVDVMKKGKNKITIGPVVKEEALNEGRVSHPARNIKKKEKVTEAIDKVDLIKAIIKKLVDEKKRKNTLLTKGYIGEAKYSKENLQCNKPKADPVGDSETGKSHVVKACEGGLEKLIRFGQKGVKGSPKKKGESKAYANRRKRFKARHAKNIAKGKMSGSYWSSVVKW